MAAARGERGAGGLRWVAGEGLGGARSMLKLLALWQAMPLARRSPQQHLRLHSIQH